ncbi:cyclic pyranopterin monophosphate synthase MoaC [Clostridium sp. BSD9I1]|uniref:cyclic pyranopterin monophosphate synthase MoaC n=1 Tax=Clostridium sp. BSD9I1 TaxID=2003589 RepID=UPI0016453DF2|nr:cyclic pyranopterin monophosphate synthase MoaC [Clostridium sp. BSD9I1]
MQKDKLTHINEQGRARMVDVSSKEITEREAVAYACIYMKNGTLMRIKEGSIKKGDVLSVSQVGGIMACKNTWNIIPMCHNINLSSCDVNFNLDEENNKVDIYVTTKTMSQTGVEMEALTAASVAALTIYDMCKAIDREMTITDVKLLKKTGGKSGDFVRE